MVVTSLGRTAVGTVLPGCNYPPKPPDGHRSCWKSAQRGSRACRSRKRAALPAKRSSEVRCRERDYRREGACSGCRRSYRRLIESHRPDCTERSDGSPATLVAVSGLKENWSRAGPGGDSSTLDTDPMRELTGFTGSLRIFCGMAEVFGLNLRRRRRL